MPSGSAQPTATPTPTPTYYDEDEPVEDDHDLSDALNEAALSVLNIALALL